MENAATQPNEWGKDLIWSWKLGCHSLAKQLRGEEFGWETDPAQVVRVCHSLIPSRGNELSEGKRRFFFQCFSGYWDEVEKVFRFGPHPQGFKWKSSGHRVLADDLEGDADEPPIQELLMFDESEWIGIFKRDAVDFLFEEHSPNTGRALQELKQSQFLRAVLEEDGPARRTRSAVRRLQLGSTEDQPVGDQRNEAGPSGAAMDTE